MTCALGSMCLLLPLESAHAQQAQLDGGALQRNLEKQMTPAAPSGQKAPVVPPKETEPAPQAGESIVTVQRFVLTGATRLESNELQKLLVPLLQRPLTLEDLQQACVAIERYYRLHGYLARASVPPQSIQDGVLTLEITEAKLGQVHVDTPNGESRFGAARAARYISWGHPAGQEINLNQITQALTTLNEVPGVSVTSAMEAGAREGETDLRVALTDGPMATGSIETNNYGARTTGVAQLSAQGALNNPLGYGDQVTASGIHSSGSTFTQAAYAIPVLPNGLRASLAASSLRYRSLPAYQANGGHGVARTVSAGLTYPLARSDESNANATLRYDRKTYANYVSALDALTSSYQIQSLHLGLSGTRADGAFGGGSSSGQVGLVLGRLHLQPDNPPYYGLYTPRDFVKLSFNASRAQTLSPGVSRLMVNLNGQLANQNLNSSEQFYLGGPYGVRAYPMAQGGGSQGVQASFEYQHSLIEGLLGIAFLDTGVVQQYVHTYANWKGQTRAGNSYSLHGTGIGIKWDVLGVKLSAIIARKVGKNPLHDQQGRAVDVDGQASKVRGWLTASYGF